MLVGEACDALKVRNIELHICCDGPCSGVPRCHVEMTELFGLAKLPGQRMLPATTSDQQNIVNTHELVIFSADRKSTRLNSSHVAISYAVFCLKKKKNKSEHHTL